MYQQAEVYRLRGQLGTAEEAYRRASELGGETQPGLALLRLAQGDSAAAAKAIRRALSTTAEPLDRMRFLPTAVEIMTATHAVDEAREAQREIEEIAALHNIPVLAAMADCARGDISFATGDMQGASAALRPAISAWQQLGARHVVACLRARLGQAYRALGDEDGAKLELDAARTIFEELGAKPDLDRIGSSSHAELSSNGHGLTKREMEVLRRLAVGDTNKAIAKQLSVSERAIDRHVSNILMKLDVPTHSAATGLRI